MHAAFSLDACTTPFSGNVSERGFLGGGEEEDGGYLREFIFLIVVSRDTSSVAERRDQKLLGLPETMVS